MRAKIFVPVLLTDVAQAPGAVPGTYKVLNEYVLKGRVNGWVKCYFCCNMVR